MLRLPVLLLIVCLNCLTLAGQKNHFQFSHLDISRGLSNNQVTAIIKDQKGFLLIGTASGLNRYDGYQFKTFTNNAKDTTSISGDKWIVSSGLNAGDRVVVEGLQKVRAGATVTTVPFQTGNTNTQVKSSAPTANP